MNARVAELDPAYAKKERWQARRFWGSLILAGIAITAATYAAVETQHNSDEITEVKTRVEHSACQENAAGSECQQVKRESARAANIATTCIPFWKAGYPCPRPGSTSAERQATRKAQVGSGSAQELNSGSDGEGEPASNGGGQALGPAQPGTHHPAGPAKGGSGGAPAPGQGGGGGAPATNEPGSGGPSQGTAETSPPESSTGSSVGLLPATVEAVGKAGGEVVGKTGEAVQGSVEGLGKGLGGVVGGGR